MSTIYLCGPRSGPHIVNTNIELFADTSEALRSLGHNVLNPVDVNMTFLGVPYSPPRKSMEQKQTLPGLRADIIALMTVCDAIALLPDWEDAVGCRVEVALAITFGYTFLHWKTGEVVDRPKAVRIAYGYHDRPSPAVAPGSALFSTHNFD